ncbi:MAG: helix-turn-helix domain-containing protein [Hyphomonadaceae bacterium]|jgi:AraC-like DNA-binding protein|nr:helix-turn-helix domain-containing protein [Hyphomonadaceae bacterium]
MSTEAVVQLDGGFDIVGSQISGALEALPIRQLEQVLDQLSNVPFCLKDCELRHVGANAAMAELCGVASRADVLGAGAGAFFDEATSESWEAHDRAVLRTRRPSRQVMAKVVLAQGRHYWLLIGRWPILGDCGELAGIAAIAQRLELSGRKDQTYRRVAEASQLIRGRLDGLIDVGDLAARLSVSVSQLERDFVSVFGVGPRRLFTKWRLELAVDLLGEERSIADVAHACGYKDQSAFSRQFGATFGMSPSKFRSSKRAYA